MPKFVEFFSFNLLSSSKIDWGLSFRQADIHDSEGRSALFYAARFGHTECARLLINQFQASVDNAARSTGKAALFNHLNIPYYTNKPTKNV